MARLHFVVEGQSEEAFVNSILIGHLAAHGVSGSVRVISPRGQRPRTKRGGIAKYSQLCRDIRLWMKEDNNADSYFTTMVDLYALPKDFPGWTEPNMSVTPLERVRKLEAAFGDDMGHERFIPYLQLHEFETLILAQPQLLEAMLPNSGATISQLASECQEFGSPEEIDEGASTAPSKRIIRHLPKYQGMKVLAASSVLRKIGLETIRGKCHHFDAWLLRLEALAEPPVSPE